MLSESIFIMPVYFILGIFGPNGQHNSIELKYPREAIPGSVGAVIYLTGESFDPRLAYCNVDPFFCCLKKVFGEFLCVTVGAWGGEGGASARVE